MGQILRQDNISKLVVASSTTITMPATYLGTTCLATIGGQQYKFTTTLTLNTASSGAGGLDTGSLAANTLYYVYLVVSSGALALCASTSGPSVGPSGFSGRFKYIGKFRTSATAATIHTAVNVITGNTYGVEQSTGWIDVSSTIATQNLTAAGGTEYARMQRVGSTMTVHFSFQVSAVGGSGGFVRLPLSCNIDHVAMDGTKSPNKWAGRWWKFNTVANNVYSSSNGVLYWDVTTSYISNLNFAFQTNSDSANFLHPPTNAIFAANDRCDLEFTVPVAEWRGLYTLE